MAATHHLLHAGHVRDDGVAGSVPLADDPQALAASRERILAEADIVVPGHGGLFATGRPPDQGP